MDYQWLLDDIYHGIGLSEDRGKVANYIPELAHIDPNQFGISL